MTDRTIQQQAQYLLDNRPAKAGRYPNLENMLLSGDYETTGQLQEAYDAAVDEWRERRQSNRQWQKETAKLVVDALASNETNYRILTYSQLGQLRRLAHPKQP